MTALHKWLSASLTVAVLLFCVHPVLAADKVVADEKTAVEKREDFKGTRSKAILYADCFDCHQSIKGEKARPEHNARNCESCHLGGDEHRQALIKGEQGRGTIAMPQNKDCEGCHKADRKLMNWKFSSHSKAGSNCTDCHTVHNDCSPLAKKPNLTASKTDKNSTMCVKCHQDVAASQNMKSHHPVKEGAMSCISCHDMHGSDQTMLKSPSERCLTCHQAIRGPKVFEHAPVAEDCMSCHAPHGSPNRRLLTVSQPAVCLQCHSIAQGKHGYGTSNAVGARTVSGAVLRGCTNCHGAIHGSHQDQLLRY